MEGLPVEALAIGPAAFDDTLTAFRLLELAAALSIDKPDDSERLEGLATDLATIQALPERERTC